MSELISKQKAIDEIKEFQSQVTCDFSKDWLNGMNEGFAYSIKVIELIDTEEAEPVIHDKWIYGENLDGFDGYRCSHCMTHFAVDDVSDYHYCPYCGSKMDNYDAD